MDYLIYAVINKELQEGFEKIIKENLRVPCVKFFYNLDSIRKYLICLCEKNLLHKSLIIAFADEKDTLKINEVRTFRKGKSIPEMYSVTNSTLVQDLGIKLMTSLYFNETINNNYLTKFLNITPEGKNINIFLTDINLPSNLIANVWKNNKDYDLIIQNVKSVDLTQDGVYSHLLVPGQSNFFYDANALSSYALLAFTQCKKLNASLVGMDFTPNSTVIINGLNYFIYTNVAALESTGLINSYNPETREIILSQSIYEAFLNQLKQILKTINN